MLRRVLWKRQHRNRVWENERTRQAEGGRKGHGGLREHVSLFGPQRAEWSTVKWRDTGEWIDQWLRVK